jgi:hypothetical protein
MSLIFTQFCDFFILSCLPPLRLVSRLLFFPLTPCNCSLICYFLLYVYCLPFFFRRPFFIYVSSFLSLFAPHLVFLTLLSFFKLIFLSFIYIILLRCLNLSSPNCLEVRTYRVRNLQGTTNRSDG